MQVKSYPFSPAAALVARAIATTAIVAGVSGTPALAQTKTIQVDGSSTVFPISEAIAEEFQKTSGGTVNVTVGISGTGGGFKRFCAGETDISNASRPIKSSERELCKAAGVKFVELPVSYDALTVVVHPENTWASTMSVEQLKAMWDSSAQGQITNWNQVNPSWPSTKMSLYAPGTDSGTFDYFGEAIIGKDSSHRSDFTASEDDNILVQGVSRDKNAIGYFGFAYYEANKDKLKSVAIDGGKGPVKPSRETVENGTYAPLSRPLFIYVNAEAINKKPEVKQFVDFYLDNVPTLAAEVGYVPLPTDAYTAVKTNFNNAKLGSVFEGRETVGVKIADLMKLEATE